MSLDRDQLYALLPAIYRIRDAENGEALYQLLSVISEQGSVLEENIRQLYDDQFIETCAPWVIPYIGDLIGANAVYEIQGAVSGRRAEVANTIGYRRRKGTLLALEQVAMDVSGLPAAAVEFFKRLITTESMHRIRPHHAACMNLRAGEELSRLGSAFDTINRTVDVRRIAPRVRTPGVPDAASLNIALHGPGRFNIPDVGVFLWRWRSFEITNATASRVDDRRYMFSPLGQNMPLFNALAPRDSFSRLTGRFDVPQPIGRREFSRNLQEFYGANKSLEIFFDGVQVDASRICCRDLSDVSDGSWGCTAASMVGVDPVLGRIQLADDLPIPRQLRVSYHYGFPAEIAGGPYDRSASVPKLDPLQFDFFAEVGSSAYPTLESAIADWNKRGAGSSGLIVLPGFESFAIDLTGTVAIQLPVESHLWIVAAQVHRASAGQFTYTADESRAVLHGNIEVVGQAASGGDPANVPPAGQLVLSSLWISGWLRISDETANIQLMDCTLVPGLALNRDGTAVNPGAASIVVDAAEASLSLVRCITGPIAADNAGTTRICSSIVDSGSRCSVAYAGTDLASEGADLHIEDSTVIGKVHVRLMELASNTIFLAQLARQDRWLAALWCSRLQAGCIRFCFLPAVVLAPRRYECLPADSSQEGLLLPQFVSLRYGTPSYCLLSGDVPLDVWTGADNGSQMGVYYMLQETQAVRNVQLRAQEYVPFGLETGVFLEPSAAAFIRRPMLYGYGYGQFAHGDPCGEDEDDLRFVGIGAALL